MNLINFLCCNIKRKRPSLINNQEDIYIEKGNTANVYQDIKNPHVCKKKYKVTVEKNIIYNEIKILKIVSKLKDINSPRYIKYNKKENTLYMDYIKGTDLCNYLIANQKNNLPIRKILKNLITQINYLHENDIIHLDLKMDNIIVNLDNYNIHILDWGNSLLLKDKVKRKILKTPYYQSPESFNNINEKYCDMWSIGVILYIFTYNKFPFSTKLDEKDNPRKFYEDIKKIVTLSEPIYLDADIDCVDLIKKMLQKDPEKRITAENALKHKYFDNI